MSSWVLIPITLLAAPASQPPPVTAEQAMSTYRDTFDAVPTRRCTAPDRADELLVCARRPDADRLPLPVEPGPGEPVRLAPGESPRAGVANCTYTCHPAFGINLGTVKMVVDGVKRALED